MARGLFAQQNAVKTANQNSRMKFYFVTSFYRLDNICIVGRKVTKTDMTVQSPDR